ncbi:MAG TPA: HPr family phosphocarrier protein [Clostridiales bacterium]|jgi:phosphotransferase system HPr-like phosphotransfer protein|nr:HPr family phosphocarrier protein [Clostridiales bacterium]
MKSVVLNLQYADVKDFVNIVSKYTVETDLKSGRYTVDAKSLLGIFSLDLSKPITLEIHDGKDADELIKELKPFIKED